MTDIHWATATNGRFRTARNWDGGVAPTPSDDAILDAEGEKFIVASQGDQTVAGIQLASNAILQIDRGRFSALAGTDGGENAGMIAVGDDASFAIGGVFDNVGTISLDSYGDPSHLLILSDTTLTGDGQIALSAGGDNVIQAAGHGGRILFNQDDTITGDGVIETRVGGRKLKVINGAFGVMEASFIASGGTGELVNTGLVEAVNGNQVQITNMTVTGKGGTLFVGESSSIGISGSTVSGQILKVAEGGYLYLDSGPIELSGVIHNGGSISVKSGVELALSGSVSFVGGGSLALGGMLEATSQVTFSNGDTLTASGSLGSGKISWVNLPGGLIKTYSYVDGLTINMGANTFVNAGTIAGLNGMGGITINGAVNNSGFIGSPDGGVVITGALVSSGTLDFVTAESTVDSSGLIEDVSIAGALVNTGTIYSSYGGGDAQVQGAVTGDGVVVIDEGAALFGSSFAENVQFTTRGGNLGLAQSQGYTGQISGFTTDGASRLYLGDIAYVGAGEATFSGTTGSGVLTVTDGTHTAHIDLIGDYTHATFTAINDGSGSEITATSNDTPLMPWTPSIAYFANAMASLSPRIGVPIQEARPAPSALGVLGTPHIQAA